MCLDQNFASVDVGMAVVLKGLSFRDVGYGLRATIRSRGSFEMDDPCNLAVKWEGVMFWKKYLCGSRAVLRRRRSLFVSWYFFFVVIFKVCFV